MRADFATNESFFVQPMKFFQTLTIKFNAFLHRRDLRRDARAIAIDPVVENRGRQMGGDGFKFVGWHNDYLRSL